LQPPQQWNGGIGYISKEMIKSHCPEPAQDIQVEYTFFKFLLKSVDKYYIQF